MVFVCVERVHLLGLLGGLMCMKELFTEGDRDNRTLESRLYSGGITHFGNDTCLSEMADRNSHCELINVRCASPMFWMLVQPVSHA